MTDEPRTIYGEKRWLDFHVEFHNGPAAIIRALGMAAKGEHLLFFNHWAGGAEPASTRIELSRIANVRTDAVPRTAQER